jgi:hypothetical protein
MRISDREVIGLLVGRYRNSAEAAAVLGLPAYTIANWRRHGVPRVWRRPLWLMCKERGVNFSEQWCTYPEERAAMRKAKRAIARENNNNSDGANDGEAGEEIPTQRPAAQRRAAAGRSVPAPPR